MCCSKSLTCEQWARSTTKLPPLVCGTLLLTLIRQQHPGFLLSFFCGKNNNTPGYPFPKILASTACQMYFLHKGKSTFTPIYDPIHNISSTVFLGATKRRRRKERKSYRICKRLPLENKPAGNSEILLWLRSSDLRAACCANQVPLSDKISLWAL